MLRKSGTPADAVYSRIDYALYRKHFNIKIGVAIVSETERIERQLAAARKMRKRLAGIGFASPVESVYDPLEYAWEAFAEYVRRFGGLRGRTLFLGMNPGPWGMAQTGIPFGEVETVNNWLKITAPIGKPEREHPKYPVSGYQCGRSEVSGRRLWGLFRGKSASAEDFFTRHFVVNYCPLLFIASKLLKNGRKSACNLTPDKLSVSERAALYEICDENLRELAAALEPSIVIGVGGFAETRAREALAGFNVTFARILHPSPASPRSNADWPGEVLRQLDDAGVVI